MVLPDRARLSQQVDTLQSNANFVSVVIWNSHLVEGVDDLRLVHHVSRSNNSFHHTTFRQAVGTSLDMVAGALRGDPGSAVRLDVKRSRRALAFPLMRAQFKVTFSTGLRYFYTRCLKCTSCQRVQKGLRVCICLSCFPATEFASYGSCDFGRIG